MRYHTRDTEPRAQHEGELHCCDRAEQMWMMDELLIAAWDRRPLLTDAIDRLPPWRARMVVGPLLRDEMSRLEHGTPELFEDAAVAAGREDAGQRGWWRRALGMDPRPAPAPRPANSRYIPPAGWKVVKPPNE